MSVTLLNGTLFALVLILLSYMLGESTALLILALAFAAGWLSEEIPVMYWVSVCLHILAFVYLFTKVIF